jgi:hypothetical protein
MRSWIGRLVLALVVVAALAVAALVLSPALARRVYDRGAARMTGQVNNAPLADDALRVAICGSSAPLASPARAKACVDVFAGGRFYIVDSGPESTENLVLGASRFRREAASC